MERTRTYHWDDPMIGAEAARRLSGRDYLTAILAGTYPAAPISRALGFTLESFDEGTAVFVCDVDEYHYNPIGVIHGGLAATLLDSAMGVAVHTTLPAGMAYTTLDIHVHLVRPLTRKTGRVRAEASVVHPGRRMATAQGRLVDAQGKLYAHGSSTCMIFPVEQG